MKVIIHIGIGAVKAYDAFDKRTPNVPNGYGFATLYADDVQSALRMWIAEQPEGAEERYLLKPRTGNVKRYGWRINRDNTATLPPMMVKAFDVGAVVPNVSVLGNVVKGVTSVPMGRGVTGDRRANNSGRMHSDCMPERADYMMNYTLEPDYVPSATMRWTDPTNTREYEDAGKMRANHQLPTAKGTPRLGNPFVPTKAYGKERM